MTDSFPEFVCANPDFTVHSNDGVQFGVQRGQLANGSEVFRDMFFCCGTAGTPAEEDQILRLQENAHSLAALLRILHDPPAPYANSVVEEDEDDIDIAARVNTDKVVPLPVLRTFFSLADKYAFSKSIVDSLHSHLTAQVSLFPLEIYAFATQHGLEKIAADASAYLLHPSLSTYSPREISIIPTAEAYHKLVLLHHERVRQLKDLLRGEDIFPRGYGECPRHSGETKFAWEWYKNNLMLKLDAGTDVAAEMRGLSSVIAFCEACQRACDAAVDMLAYKFQKIIKRIDQLPSD